MPFVRYEVAPTLIKIDPGAIPVRDWVTGEVLADQSPSPATRIRKVGQLMVANNSGKGCAATIR
jgi:hypothetical protein